MERYTLDLSRVFSDHRQKVFVGRRSSWNHIKCLLDHVRSIFEISANIYLTNGDNVLFPDFEVLDVILNTDTLRVHCSDSSSNVQNKRMQNNIAKPKACASNETLKRKYESFIREEKANRDSGSESEEEENNLPKKSTRLEAVAATSESVQEAEKPKRKRIRKRKSKKKEDTPSPKVVVKTYGKSKIPPIVIENGESANHVRFSEDDEEKTDIQSREEPYMNCNRNVVPRVVCSVSQSSVTTWNDEIPSVPEYDDTTTVELDDIVQNGQRNRTRSRKPKKAVEIKQELIDTNTAREQSPTWDTEINEDKERFLSNYSGEEFWAGLRDAVENFPAISIPSVHDIIAYRLEGEHCLSFVERVDGDDESNMFVSTLTLRKLNIVKPCTSRVKLNQLTDVRLVATYQG